MARQRKWNSILTLLTPHSELTKSFTLINSYHSSILETQCYSGSLRQVLWALPMARLSPKPCTIVLLFLCQMLFFQNDVYKASLDISLDRQFLGLLHRKDLKYCKWLLLINSINKIIFLQSLDDSIKVLLLLRNLQFSILKDTTLSYFKNDLC